jgi:hypothetical protein
MSARHSLKIALVVVCLIALTAVAAGARTPGQPDATAATAPLYTRVLSLDDLHGFWSVTCPVAVTSAAQWAEHASSAGELERSGFMNGLREPLHATGSTAQAWSAVAQFRTPAGARSESLAELGRARQLGGTFAGFAVPEIPGSHGYWVPNGRTSQIAVGFTEGRFQYLLEISGVGASDAAALRARLTAAAVALYHRAQAHG